MINRQIDDLSIFKKGIEQSLDGIVVISMEGEITYANNSWVNMHGFDPDQMSGVNVRSFHTEQQFLEEFLPFKQQVLSNGRHIGLVEHVKKDGTIFPARMSVTLLLDDNEVPIGFLAFCRDRTLFQKAEDEVVRQKEKAEQANIVKNEFLLKVSHELRTPMNGIIGNASLLGFTSLSSEQQECVDALTESSERMMGLIDNLLEFSSVSVEHEFAYSTQCTVQSLFKNVVSNFRELAKQKEITIQATVESGVFDAVIADKVRMHLVLSNLLSNAVKFSGHGASNIRLVAKQGRNVGQVEISVHDKGIGIKDDFKQAVFTSFTQEYTGASRKYEGMGVGLYISKLLVERLNGEIWFESKKGEGSAFYFAVPIIGCDIR